MFTFIFNLSGAIGFRAPEIFFDEESEYIVNIDLARPEHIGRAAKRAEKLARKSYQKYFCGILR